MDWTDTSVSIQHHHIFEEKDLMERYLALEAYSLLLAGKVIRETRRAYRETTWQDSASLRRR